MSQKDIVANHKIVSKTHEMLITYSTLDFIYPSAGKIMRSLKLSFVFVCMAGAISCCIYTLFTSKENISMLYSLIYAGVFYQTAFKHYVFFISRRKDFETLLEYMESLTKTGSLEFADEIRHKRLTKSTNLAFLCSKIFLFSVYSTAFCLSIYGLMETNYLYPMFFRIPNVVVDDENPLKRPIAIVYTYLCFGMICFIALVGDVLFFMILAYFEGELGAIVEVIAYMNESETAKKESRKILRFVYEAHRNVLRNLRILRDIYWHLNLHLIATNFIYLCLLLFITRFYEAAFPTYMAAICAVMQLFVLCFFGQILRNRTEAIGDALYHTRWYKMERREKLAVLIMMSIGQEAIGLDAGGIMNLSFNTFANVMRTAISYGAILYTVMQ